jgi:hypothetical protein
MTRHGRSARVSTPSADGPQDHKSHVAYSNGGGLGTPNCPSTHPVRIPQVMYEVVRRVPLSPLLLSAPPGADATV